ncbi:MAG: DUF4908 domain-containing protein [Hyphococcus sp.]|nr:MAG: DUF4908 domain-containing protein [Marinicaulis sp.]
MRRFFTVLLTSIIAAAASAPVSALPSPEQGVVLSQSTDPFSALVGKRVERRSTRRASHDVQRYVLASDDRAFLFEERTNGALIKFLCGADDPRLDCSIDPESTAAEIYQLLPTRGPRGDVIYKNAEGDTLLRIASYGGATVFWPGEGRGYGASKSFGDDASLGLPLMSRETAERRARAATALISALTGAPIIFEVAPVAGPPSMAKAQTTAHSTTHSTALAPVLADAVVRTAAGLQMVANDPTGARIIANRIQRVLFQEAAVSNVDLAEGVLTIQYVPEMDIEGRPSSRAVARYLEETL